MATNIGQYATVFLLGETPVDREAWQASLQGCKESPKRYHRSDSVYIGTIFFFFACGSSAPVRVDCEGHAAAWLAGTLVAPSVQGHVLPLH